MTMTHHVRVALGVMLWASSACYTTSIRSGLPADEAVLANRQRWHHGLLWGIAELSGPYDLRALCPQGWAEIETETSFLNGLLDAITRGIYAPQTVTVRCAALPDYDASDAALSGSHHHLDPAQ